MDLITNRSQAHIDRLKYLLAKGWNNLNTSERQEWYDYAAKGAYNYTDLNRVESAVAELAEKCGLTLTTKTDWNLWDVPTQDDMSRYLGNIQAIKNACPGGGNYPEVPLRMAGLTFEAANRIEEILFLCYRGYDAIPRTGDYYCGEV